VIERRLLEELKVTPALGTDWYQAMSSTGSKLCTICDERMPLYSMTSLGCQHWFCNDCYGGFLQSTIAEGNVEALTCPALGCQETVDACTTASLVSYQDFAKYSAFLLNSYIDQRPNISWCPSVKCRRATEAFSQEDGMFISCACGSSWCFSCRKAPHWPCSCRVASYALPLSRSRSISPPTTFMRVTS